MTSPLTIPNSSHIIPSTDDAVESNSYGSNCTDLSINSRNVVVADQWMVSGKIGEGSFGEVFKVRDINTNQCYAIKRENLRTKHSQLKYESTMYDVLSGGVGIPRCYWHGNFDGFECIVMDLLGPNLSEVRQNVSSMELDIAIDLVCQMVSIVEDIHNRGVIVRDIKPDNFLFASRHRLPETEMIDVTVEFGMPMTSYKKPTCRQVLDEQWGDRYPKLYAVDFGLACYWRDPETGKTYPDTKKHIRSKTGTARYASINVHRGRSHSRRDDVESIGYILLDLLMGTLPWTGIHARNSKAGWDRMRQLKIDTFMSDLCAGLPDGVLKFVEYPRKLQFGDQPDYDKMRQYLRGSLPGGAYAQLVKSPFGGQTKSTDNYDVIQQELKQLQEKQLQEQQQTLNQYSQNLQNEMQHDTTKTNEPPKKEESYQPPERKSSSTSQSSIEKLLKENLTKAVGWNTYKHDQAPWNPKITWTNDDDQTATSNVARSWGDDHKDLGTWGDTPSARADQIDSWGNDSDMKQVKWNDHTSWGSIPPPSHDKKSLNADPPLAATWGEQPSWDTAPSSTQRDEKESAAAASSWGKQTPWDAAPPSTQPDIKESTVTMATWGNQTPWDTASPTQRHDDKAPMNRNMEPKRGRQSFRKPTSTTHHTKKESRNILPGESKLSNSTRWPSSSSSRIDHVEHQWKEASSWTNSAEQVDGWQRKPGSNSWQQKQQPLAK